MLSRIKIDYWLVCPIIILLLFSQAIQRSVLPVEAGKHLLISLLGIAAFFFMSGINYRSFYPLARAIYAFSILLLVLTFIFGESTRGSVRWLKIGSLTLQTSELVKPLIIFSLSSFARSLKLGSKTGILKFGVFALLPVLLIIQQPDLGSAFVLLTVGFAISLAAGVDLRYFFVIFIITLLSFPLLYQVLKPYQRQRIQTYIDPFSDPLGNGYSMIQSMIAVGSGRMFGRGLGHGTQSQLQFLPERHSDFIFASLAEELGFVGSFLLITSYFLLLSRLLVVANQSSDLLGSILVIGVFMMLVVQVGVNIGMNVGILPITGITLPLISSGGSSMLVVMISLGLVHSVSLQRKISKTIEIH